MEIYLDNAATTRVYPEVAETVKEIMCRRYGNPSSAHLKGVEAERIVKKSTAVFAKILKAGEREIYYTSGGTESNNWALFSAAFSGKRSGKRIITSSIEHESVSAPLKHLKEEGYEVVTIGTDENGVVKTDELKAAINDETILVSIMMANNETGVIQPVSEIGRCIKDADHKIIFHVDGIQAFGKFRINPKQSGIDLLSLSAHKIHGPKGAGILYISDKVKMAPFIYGGGQQNGMRSGTVNVPSIAGFAKAADIMYGSLEENVKNMYSLRRRLIEGLNRFDSVVVNSPDESICAPHIVNASFVGVKSEVLLHSLAERGIYVSSGSACSSHRRALSASLSSMGKSREVMESAVRFSFCEYTTQSDVDETLNSIEELLPFLRRYVRR